MLHWFPTWFLGQGGDEGQDMAEYALLLGLITAALIIALMGIAGGLGNLFNAVRDVLKPSAPLPA